jgi:carboxyl-terminal processing protease
MLNGRMWRKGLAVMIPAILLVLALGVGGTQETGGDLFAPVYQIYQYIKSYFYQPERIDDQQALYGAMKGIVQHLDDPYSEFLDPDDRQRFDETLDGKFSGVGIELSIVDNVITVITPLVGTPAEAAGVDAGDQILRIDGESTEGMTLTEAAVRIRGETGTTVTLTVRHDDGSIEEIPIVRDTIVLEPVKGDLLADGQIGYIRLYRFEQDTTTALDSALSSFDLDGLTGFILDLRNNPGGLLNEAISVSSRFVDDGVLLITEDRLSDEKKYYARGNRIPNIPLVVLINRGTASASEITAGAIRDNDMGILIGERSFGKGVYQQLIEFPDGSALKITAGEYFTPDRRVVNGIGLTPDIEVSERGSRKALAPEAYQEYVAIYGSQQTGSLGFATPWYEQWTLEIASAVALSATFGSHRPSAFGFERLIDQSSAVLEATFADLPRDLPRMQGTIDAAKDPVDVAIAWIRAHAGVEMPIDLDVETAQAP